MTTNLYHFTALWMMLMLPLAVAQCNSTFLNGLQDLHVLKAQAKTETDDYVSISTSSAEPISLESVNKIHDVGCMGDQAFGYKLRMFQGDKLRVKASGRGTLQFRTMRSLKTTLHFLHTIHAESLFPLPSCCYCLLQTSGQMSGNINKLW